MAIRAVIFDLFHTLISLKTDGVAGPSTSQILGVDEDAWNGLLFQQSDKRLRGHLTDPVEILFELVEIGGWEISKEVMIRAARAREKRFAAGMKAVKPHVLAALDAIRGRGLLTGLCSNADRMERQGWQDSPLSGRFDAAVFSCDVGFIKPQPQIYHITLQRLGVEPCEAVFVGDGGSGELRGARQAGMTTVFTTEILSKLWPDLLEARKTDADYVIDNIAQVIDCL